MAVDQGGGAKPKIIKPPAPRFGSGAIPKPPVATSLRAINIVPAKPATSLRAINVMPPTPPAAPKSALTYTAGGFNADQMRNRSFNPYDPTNKSYQAQPKTHPGDLGNQYVQGGRGFYIPYQGGSLNTQTNTLFNPTMPQNNWNDNGGDSDGGGGGGGGGGGSYGPRQDFFSLGLVNWRI